MKSIMTAFLWVILCASPVWSEPVVWTIPRYVNVVAKEVQSRISDKAHEGLFEAKRFKNGWLYTYQVGYGKSWTEVVQIRLTSVSSRETRIQVDAYRVEKGVLFDSKKESQESRKITASWLKEM